MDISEERLKFYKDLNELELYNLEKERYCIILINAYSKTRKYIKDSKEIQNDLLKKFKKEAKEVLNFKHIQLKNKIKIVLGYYCPNLYAKLLIPWERIRCK